MAVNVCILARVASRIRIQLVRMNACRTLVLFSFDTMFVLNVPNIVNVWGGGGDSDFLNNT